MIEARGAGERIVRLQDGDDVMHCLGELGMNSAWIVGAIGMVRDATLAYWNGREYESHAFPAPSELVAVQGNLAVDEAGRIVVHAHAVLATRDGTVGGGHLVGATAHGTVEAAILPLEGIRLRRQMEPSGLNGLIPTAN